MARLDGFREMDFLDQITVLNEIAASKDGNELDGLRELFANPVGDASIDYMVVNALNGVLSANEPETVKGLASGDEEYRTLCIRVAGEYAFASAAAPLADIADATDDEDLLLEILPALARIGDPSALPVFRKYAAHADRLVAAQCLEALGNARDESSLDIFRDCLEANNADGAYEQCEITSWKAVEALAAIATEPALTLLTAHLHHRNPTVRRIITDAMVNLGEIMAPFLVAPLEEGDTDNKILAANILGFIGAKPCADILVRVFDKGVLADPNVKYAVYEALGRTGTMKGIICLMDGLDEQDELILMAVVTGLERHVNPGMLKALAQRLGKGDEQSGRLASAVIGSRSVKLFKALFDGQAAQSLTTALTCSNDPDIHDAFREVLEAMDSDAAREATGLIPAVKERTGRALAADDSRSMLAVHRAILTDMGFDPVLASNGQEAFDNVEQGETFDVIITDMNMPVMDGMELVEKLRATEGFESVPIIMVTTESEGSQRALAEKTGVTAFITKPFKPVQLKDMIADLVGA